MQTKQQPRMKASEYRQLQPKRGRSKLEETLESHINMAGLPTPETEYQFAKPRRWRFDFAWIDRKIACEVEGGVFINGGHTRGAAYEKNCEKYNAAALAGWSVYRFTGNQIKDGSALAVLQQALQSPETRLD
jgi:very-short-patch-repair endonuclease